MLLHKREITAVDMRIRLALNRRRLEEADKLKGDETADETLKDTMAKVFEQMQAQRGTKISDLQQAHLVALKNKADIFSELSRIRIW